MSNDGEDPELLARIRAQQIGLLEGVQRRRLELAETERSLVHGARREGISWDEIAGAIGISAAIAREQYGEPEPETG